MQLVIDKKLEDLIKHSLDRQTCGTYTRSTVVDGLSVGCEAVSLYIRFCDHWAVTALVRLSAPVTTATHLRVIGFAAY